MNSVFCSLTNSWFRSTFYSDTKYQFIPIVGVLVYWFIVIYAYLGLVAFDEVSLLFLLLLFLSVQVGYVSR